MNLEPYGVFQQACDTGIPLLSLEDKNQLLPIIERYANYLETDSIVIASSLFLKRYAVLIGAASLDYYGLREQKMDWITLATFDANNFQINVTTNCEKEIEGCWKEKVFYQHLKTIVEILSRECKVNKDILWENIAVRINAVFQRGMDKFSKEKTEMLYKELTDPHPSWFGEANNPLQKYIFLHNENRKTCCRYYQLTKKEEGMPYCLVCPLKKTIK